ncbi:MAG: hypothetical protein M3Q80_01625 [bacterium]|nr:hypothetical protein [bacterium]
MQIKKILSRSRSNVVNVKHIHTPFIILRKQGLLAGNAPAVRRNNSTKKGFTLVETLFYTAGLVVMLMVMGAFLYYMYDWYQKVTLGPRVDRIGINTIDKVIKDIRSGDTVNVSQSVLNSATGTLSLATFVNSVSVTKTIAVSNYRLTYRENLGVVQYLTPADLYITRFYVTSTSTPVSEGVKFDIDIAFGSRNGTTTQTYSGFSILRQSY